MNDRIPFTVIGGYLGAGKTTLLNHILRNNDGRRFALLVNDFGSINIDAALIKNQDGETINLANGCICCTLAAGFASAIYTILERDPLPDHIIVEASGVADPHKVAQYGRTPRFYLDGIIVVVDAELVRMKASDKYVGQMIIQQLKSADILILNKIDLINEQQRKEVRGWLNHITPQSHIYETQMGVVPLELLLGLETKQVHSRISEFTIQADTEFVSGSYVNDEPLQRQAFENFLTEMPESILRAKGILYLADQPEKRMIFQQVGRRWSLTPEHPWSDEKPQSQIVWIGLKGEFEPENMSGLLEKFLQQSNSVKEF